MTHIKLLLFLLFITNLSFSQSFITIDKDTNEFIEDVNFNLYQKNIKVFSSTCSNDKKTTLPANVIFDSIIFSKVNYKTLVIPKSKLEEVVLLTKEVFSLDEIVISSTKKEIITLGEKNRFIKRRSNGLSSETDNGIVFKNPFETTMEIDKVIFYVERVNFRTLYRIKFYEFNQNLIENGIQFAELGALIYTTDTLTLEPKQKGKIEVLLAQKIILGKESVFVSIEKIGIYEDGVAIKTNLENTTKIKHQISNLTNSFERRADLHTGELSEMYNINAVVNYDFATQFFKKPHKSILVAPVILLEGKKVKYPVNLNYLKN